MKRYKLHTKIIDIIINIYNNEKTILTRDKEIIDEMEITSGIKQGCNGSTVLFLLITYIIIEELNKLRIGFKTKKLKINNLFFADDGILLSETIEETELLINKLQEIGKQCGLEINKDKSHILITKENENIQEISNIKKTKEV